MKLDQPIPYLHGLPLVACQPLSDSEREELRQRSAANGKRLVVLGVAGLICVLAFIQVAVNAFLPGELCFFVLAFLVVTLALTWVQLSQARSLYSDAAGAIHRLTFRGRPRRRWPLDRRHVREMVVYTPGWLRVTPDTPRAIQVCRVGSVSYAAPARRSSPGLMTSNEYEELLFRTDRMLTMGSWRSLLGGVILGAFLYMSVQARLELMGVFVFGLGSLLGFKVFWGGVAMFRLGLKMDSDCQRGPILTACSATSGALAHASLRYPILERSLYQVESLPCGVVWTVDGRPAPWRMSGGVPDYVPPNCLAAPPVLVRQP